MAEICCRVVSNSKSSVSCEANTRSARRKRMEVRRFKFVPEVETVPAKTSKRKKLEESLINSTSTRRRRESENGLESFVEDEGEDGGSGSSDLTDNSNASNTDRSSTNSPVSTLISDTCPKFGLTSVCGRRRDMEDAVAVHPSFCEQHGMISTSSNKLHYFGVYDGHGCSHVALNCRERLHELVKEEVEKNDSSCSIEWKNVMHQSFARMDQEAVAWSPGEQGGNCRCELQTPQCDAVGSTAVIAVVTPDKVVVANCGDSRAVLCRGGRAIPLSLDHKPDRPDELNRIQEAGGRVIYWDGPRVLGVLAMSRAIGDNYLKPFVSSEPEIVIENRTDEDECLILASDGLWDVMSNETACGVARMCLNGREPNLPPPPPSGGSEAQTLASLEGSDKVCSDAALLLTKLAMARNTADNVSVVVVDLRRNLYQYTF